MEPHEPIQPPAPKPPNSGADRAMVWLALALSLLSCLPFVFAHYPQMADFPSHLARYHIMLDGGRSSWLARYYDFDWQWSGNLGVDLLMWPATALFGLEPAARIIAGIIPPLTGIAVMTVEWTLRRRIGLGTMLALATVWSPAMLLGFTNFSLSFALALFAFAGWIRLSRSSGGLRWRPVVFLPLGLVIWLCHVAGWGVLGVLVFGYEWQQRRLPRALLAPWPLFLPALPLLLTGGAAGATIYGRNILHYKLSIFVMALRDRSYLLDTETLGLLVVVIIITVFRRRFDWRIGRAALIFALLALLLPRHLGGGDYTDFRLIAVALTAGCLALDWRAPRWLVVLASSLFLIRLAVTTEAWHASSRHVSAMLKALDHVPEGAVIAAAVPENPAIWKNDLLQHVPSYATVRRDALVNTHFAQPGVHMLRLRPGLGGFIDPSQRIMLMPGTTIDLAAFPPARGADYLWYIGKLPPATMPPGAVIVFRTPDSFLARLAKVPSAR